jgi:hypothetical protein
MNLQITDTSIILQLDWHERLWAFHLSPRIDIPIASIRGVTVNEPRMEWYALRAPGTALPGVFVAGTYYTRRGREFWYVSRNPNYLVLDIEGEYYKRIVLTLADNRRYADQLMQRLAA